MLAELIPARLCRAVFCLLCAACASPPPHRPGDLPPVGAGKYASVGRCTPTTGSASCPGASCGTSAVGAADGTTLDLRACGTLDVAFTGGDVIASVGQPELAVLIAPPLDGGMRIEASAKGDDYVIVGFAKHAPPGTASNCMAAVEDQRVLVDLDNCNTISSARFLRLIYEPGGGNGSVLIDALEALSFKPR